MRIEGTDHAEYLQGTPGSDYIRAFGGNDEVEGFGGNDVIIGDNGNDVLSGDDGADQLSGGNGNDRLDGGSEADIMLGGAGDDLLNGSDAGPASADRMTGGAGSDIFALGAGRTSSVLAAQDIITDFEGAGAPSGDRLVLTDPYYPNLFLYHGLVDKLPQLGDVIGTSNDTTNAGDYITDVYTAFDGPDTILFADTNDTGTFDSNDLYVRISGHQLFDRADFANTDDFGIAGTSGNDTLTGGDGIDLIFGLGGDDHIVGGGSTDGLYGGDGRDYIDGGAAGDFIEGGRGNDTIFGGLGSDRLFGGDGADTIDGGAGNDEISGGEGNDIIHGGSDDDIIFGDNGDNRVFGDDGNDILQTLAGFDRLDGGSGNDSLDAGVGADKLTGGDGQDRFLEVLSGYGATSTFEAADIITDFEGAGKPGGDLIAIRSSSGGAVTLTFLGELAIDPVLGASLPGGGDGKTELFFTHGAGNTFLIADTNNNGTLDKSDFTVELAGNLALTQDDFENLQFSSAAVAAHHMFAHMATAQAELLSA